MHDRLSMSAPPQKFDHIPLPAVAGHPPSAVPLPLSSKWTRPPRVAVCGDDTAIPRGRGPNPWSICFNSLPGGGHNAHCAAQSDDPADESYPPGSGLIDCRRKGNVSCVLGKLRAVSGLLSVVPTLLGYVEPHKKGYHLRTKGTSNFF